MHGKFGLPTSDHEPVDGIRGDEPTNFTSEFLYGCHAFKV